VKASRVLTIVSLVGSLCSITGITTLLIVKSICTRGPQPQWFRWLFWIVIPVLGGALVVLSVLWSRLRATFRLWEGSVIGVDKRAELSRAFARGSLRSLRIFAGDLSWLEEDLTIYRDLRKRGVQIRVLADAPSSTAVQAGKLHGIEFRQYPNAASAPLKATVSDADEEGESRALVFKRRTPRPPSEMSEYGYWVKEYHGSMEYPVVRCMALLFDELWQGGTPL
jgi:hypothetical protein